MEERLKARSVLLLDHFPMGGVFSKSLKILNQPLLSELKKKYNFRYNTTLLPILLLIPEHLKFGPALPFAPLLGTELHLARLPEPLGLPGLSPCSRSPGGVRSLLY